MTDVDPVDDEFERFRVDLLGEDATAEPKKYESGLVFFGSRKERFEGDEESDQEKKARIEAFETRIRREAGDRKRVEREAEAARKGETQAKRKAARQRMAQAMVERRADEERESAAEQARVEASDPFSRFKKERKGKPKRRKPEPQAAVDPNEMFFGESRGGIASGSAEEDLDPRDAAKRERLEAFEARLKREAEEKKRGEVDAAARRGKESLERRRQARERMERALEQKRAEEERAATRKRAGNRRALEQRLAADALQRGAELQREAEEQARIDALDPFARFREQQGGQRARAQRGNPVAALEPNVRSFGGSSKSSPEGAEVKKKSRRISRLVVKTSGASPTGKRTPKGTKGGGQLPRTPRSGRGKKGGRTTSRRIPRKQG